MNHPIACVPVQRFLCSATLLLLLAGLSACGSKEKAAGQSVARVNGEEITLLQINDELQKVGAGQKVTSRQVLDALVDRQLLVNEAQHDKLDRDPAIMQAVERAKAQIFAQAYLQKKFAGNSRPSKAEINTFFDKNPDLFSQRKQFEFKEVIVDVKSLSPELNTLMKSAKSLDEVTAWLDGQKIAFVKSQSSRSSADLQPNMVKAIKAMPKGQLFTIKEDSRGLLMALADTKDTPVTQEAATAQIGQFLINQKNKEVGTTEIARLRAAGKIEYLNLALVSKDKPEAAPIPEAKPDNAATANHISRGVAGLK